jgi:hypothetical protein
VVEQVNLLLFTIELERAAGIGSANRRAHAVQVRRPGPSGGLVWGLSLRCSRFWPGAAGGGPRAEIREE